jgi:type IV pilus assembly protein PilC
VGDATGSLPEVLKALADHYDNNLRLRRDFLGQITLPVIQLLAAIFIVAGLICLLGWVASMTGHAVDVLGWGLLGTRGALIWLGGWTMLAVSGVVAYKFVTTSLSGQKAIHRLLLSIPVVGSTLRNFAIARFSWAFHLTQNAGMPIDDSLEASLRATSNGAFLAAAPDIIAEITEGATLTDALDHTHLFPVEFIEYVMVAEQTGTVPEALDRLSPQFEENARRSLQALAAALSWLVWAGVAAFIIFIIFTVVFWYLRMLDDAMKGF